MKASKLIAAGAIGCIIASTAWAIDEDFSFGDITNQALVSISAGSNPVSIISVNPPSLLASGWGTSAALQAGQSTGVNGSAKGVYNVHQNAINGSIEVQQQGNPSYCLINFTVPKGQKTNFGIFGYHYEIQPIPTPSYTSISNSGSTQNGCENISISSQTGSGPLGGRHIEGNTKDSGQWAILTIAFP